jgi:hypothetical protein
MRWGKVRAVAYIELEEYMELASNKKGRQEPPKFEQISETITPLEIPIEASVLYCFTDVFGSNIITSGHVGYRPPNFQNPIIRTR